MDLRAWDQAALRQLQAAAARRLANARTDHRFLGGAWTGRVTAVPTPATAPCVVGCKPADWYPTTAETPGSTLTPTLDAASSVPVVVLRGTAAVDSDVLAYLIDGLLVAEDAGGGTADTPPPPDCRIMAVAYAEGCCGTQPAGATFTVFGPGGYTQSAPMVPTIVGATTGFLFAVMDISAGGPGTWSFAIAAPGYQTVNNRDISFGTAGPPPQLFDLRCGDTLNVGVGILPRTTVPSTKTLTTGNGTVTLSHVPGSGEPLAGPGSGTFARGAEAYVGTYTHPNVGGLRLRSRGDYGCQFGGPVDNVTASYQWTCGGLSIVIYCSDLWGCGGALQGDSCATEFGSQPFHFSVGSASFTPSDCDTADMDGDWNQLDCCRDFDPSCHEQFQHPPGAAHVDSRLLALVYHGGLHFSVS
jgi:hypothetical protein